MAKKAAVVFGVVFLLVGVLGFIANPLVGVDALFHTDMMHNIVHLLSGAVLVFVGMKNAKVASATLVAVGVIYLLVAVLGIVMVGFSETGSILGLIETNGADHILHVILGAVILGAGLMSKEKSPMAGMDTMDQGQAGM